MVSSELPRLNQYPSFGLSRKIENGALAKHKAGLVARVFTQVSGIDDHEIYLYAPVICLESLRAIRVRIHDYQAHF